MWVSEFVETLKTELESTFKEEISVYFDINPHDGLLETHDVDESLKDKLKCLVFIPIISRTYCDPKSFAWEHEFKAFVEQASGNQPGLKVKLPGGNIGNRVLPVRIHELDNEDLKLIESILGGYLRGVEFIYKSPGVNRPLRSKEDSPNDNLNNTFYRDQINKVANAIGEIISGIKAPAASETEDKKSKTEKANSPGKRLNRKLKKRHVLLPLFIVIAILGILIFSGGSSLPFAKRDWLLITDFENYTEDPVFDNSLYTAFTLSTSQSRYINVYPRSRMLETLSRMEIPDQLFVNEKTGLEIAQREAINIIIVPSISKVGNKYAITAKIVETASGDPLKSEIVYAENQDDILPKLDKLSKTLRRDFGESLYRISTQDNPLVKVTTSSLEALKLYSLGIDENILMNFEKAKDYYSQALQIDTGFIAAKASLGNLLFDRFDQAKGKELLAEAVKSVDKLTDQERLGILAFYSVNVEDDLSKGIEYAKMLADLYPDIATTHNNLGYYYSNAGLNEEAVKEYKLAIGLNPHLAITYSGLIWTYLTKIGEIDSALVWAKKMIYDYPDNAWSYNYMGSVCFCLDSLSSAEKNYKKARELDPELIFNLYRLVHTYRVRGNYEEALKVLENVLEIDKNELVANIEIGRIYLAMGNKEKAQKYFTNFKRLATDVWIKKWPDHPATYSSLACVYALLGDIDTSNQMLNRAIALDSTLYINYANVLCLQDRLPDALDQIEKALENGYRDLTWLKMDPDLSVLHDNNRFKNLLNKYFN